MTAFKALTHDLRPPLQGGEPIWDGTTLPHTLPAVRLDTSPKPCAPGWHFSTSVEGCIAAAGLWPTGRPSRVVRVEPSADAIEREGKHRASSLTITGELSDAEIEAAIGNFSARRFGEHAEVMAREQIAWRQALSRPHHSPDKVEECLRQALEHRGLDWSPRRFTGAWDARDAWAAWNARAAWDAWDAWNAQAARREWDWDAWNAWNTQAAWNAQAAWAAWNARAALAATFAALSGWIDRPPDLLTKGLRDAFRHGLAIALPTGPRELGWAMEAA